MCTVNIMMSTYNGEKYLRQQLNSIFSQRNINIKLYIRDDGSSDDTLKIIQEYMVKNNIILYKGENIGWRKSFLELTKLVDLVEDDYYAFSDQDDVWLEDKLNKAVSYLESIKDIEIRAYCSSLQFVNENLNPLDYKGYKKFEFPNEYHVIVNGYGMGCTEVFSSKLLLMMRQCKEINEKISHDVLVSVIGEFFGKIYRDSNSYILYRQHNSNAGSKNENLIRKIKRIRNFEDVFIFEIAKLILDNFENKLNDYQKNILKRYKHMDLIGNKVKLLFNKYVSRDTLLGSLKLKVYILLYRKGGL